MFAINVYAMSRIARSKRSAGRLEMALDECHVTVRRRVTCVVATVQENLDGAGQSSIDQSQSHPYPFGESS